MPSRTLPSYITPAQIRTYYNQNTETTSTSDISFYEDLASAGARWLDQFCNRRFDPYIATFIYPSRTQTNGGMIDRDGFLLLDQDITEIISLESPSGVSVGNTISFGEPVIRKVRPEPFTAWAGDYIYLTAHCGGFGGRWTTLAATLSTGMNSSTTSLTITSNVLTEGMLIRVEDEYLYVSAWEFVTTPTPLGTAVVERGFNGTTAASHSSGVAISRFLFDPVITRHNAHLMAGYAERQKSPLSGTVVIGDFTYPINSDGIPKDVVTELSRGGYIRPIRIKAP